MAVDFHIVIPARYASARLPGKPLRLIHHKPMIQWVYEAAAGSDAKQVIVATDDERISSCVRGFGAKVCMTSDGHQTGSDRLVEVAQKFSWDDDTIVVNLQGDEPLMPASNMTQVAQNLQSSDCDMATLHKIIDTERAQNANQVKLVHDYQGRVLYFSRSPIPFDREQKHIDYCGHIGIYAYRVGFLNTFTRLEICEIEADEKLEQLRTLWHGYSIHTELAAEPPGPGVDTEDDLLQVIRLIDQS
ncbi:MAG: 3-deoxy-manno-octulosonate cytidylyltransferase [Gammaproteobacteria bacterium]|nr:3-deoxy-manno-octulosonate cytidylyltransferase [Gammaproteobacteria bacterium]MCZ6669081.1 3-deoxy-manno-octulosonate cytidylyltransferase [Gammaproteobacteria bacterium]